MLDEKNLNKRKILILQNDNIQYITYKDIFNECSYICTMLRIHAE